MKRYTDIRQVDAAGLALLIDCSIQAYAAFDVTQPTQCMRARVKAPAGFELLDCWSGVDALFGTDRSVEIYGLVFVSCEAPWHYIFAFRGTDDVLDAIDDLGLELQRFHATDGHIEVGADVQVESGFYDIYQDSDDNVPAMRHQLFALIDKYQASARPITRLSITGHSLGAALSQLFSLDLALCRPEIAARNINFASPRVGNPAFVRLLEQQLKGPALRVQNLDDVVPDVPPVELGFAHTFPVFLVEFHANDALGRADLLAAHSSVNYQAVIACAAASTKGMCIAAQLPVSGNSSTLCSEAPDPTGSRQPALAKLGFPATGL